MAEPLLGRAQLVVHRVADAALVQLIGATPGPAGTSTIEFEQATVDLDGAHPGQLCVLSLHDVVESSDLLERQSLLERLLGSERVAELLRFIDSDEERPYRLQGDRHATRNMRGEVRPDVALLAVAISQMNSPGLLPIEHALGVLEAAGLAQRAGLLDDIEGLRAELDGAVDLIVSTSVEVLHSMDGVGNITMAELLGESIDLVDNALRKGQLRSLATRLDEAPTGWQGEHLLAMRISASRAVPFSLGSAPRRRARTREDVGELVAAQESPNSLPGLVGGPKLELHEGTGHELVTRLEGWGDRADGWWLRAFHGEQQVPIAVAPFRPNSAGDAVATFLVAPAYRDSLQVDVVEDPNELRVPPEAGAFQRAIAVGQRAARYERVGDRTRAQQAWNDCSAWHQRAGDATRSKHAHAIADEQEMGSLARTGNSLRALLTDRTLSDSIVTP